MRHELFVPSDYFPHIVLLAVVCEFIKIPMILLSEVQDHILIIYKVVDIEGYRLEAKEVEHTAMISVQLLRIL